MNKKPLVIKARPSQQSIRRRHDAVIQLRALLDEPAEALPISFQQPGDSSLTDKKLTVQDVSKMLNTPSCMIERIVNVLNRFSHNNQFSLMSRVDVQRMTRILNGSIDVRALVFFCILDEEQDDFITKQGFMDFYEMYLKNIRSFDHSRIPQYIDALLQKFHLDEQDQIDFDEFYSIVRKDPILLQSLAQFTVDPTWSNGTSNPSPSKPKLNPIRKCCINLCSQETIYEDQQSIFTIDYIRDHFSRVIFFILYILINITLLLYVIIYRTVALEDHVLTIFARIGGMLLNFNCAFIVILMLKRTILGIRSNEYLRKWIPIDDHIDFHQYVGRFIAALVILHTAAHMANFGRPSFKVNNSTWKWHEYMFTTRPGLGWINGFASLSGIILCIILAIMIICSLQWIRRGGHFQVFYWTHLLYYLFYFFLILHSKNCWKWIIGPFSIFLLEKAYSVLTRYSSRSGRSYIRWATIEQSNVISLNIHRPKNFTFKPGDYITINIPHIAYYEYHPFTISSAPEETSYITVHIQASGNWTKKVYEHFKEISAYKNQENSFRVYRVDLNTHRAVVERIRREGIEREESANSEISTTSSQMRKEIIFINGPYSSCARYVFDCPHVVLVGGGIGVTPYASILSSLMTQFRASRVICKNCQHINYNQKGLLENRRLKKVDFIWINRDYKNFEWFLDLLRQFEDEQDNYLNSNPNERRFLDIHLYFTEIKHDQNIGHVPLDLVTKIWAQVAGQDIFTSLKAKTHIGRPKWEDIFNGFTSDNYVPVANDVAVFFCGPATMGQTIKKHCRDFRFRYYEEKF